MRQSIDVDFEAELERRLRAQARADAAVRLAGDCTMQAERVAPEGLVAERVEPEDLATAQNLDEAGGEVALIGGRQGLQVLRHPGDVGLRIVRGGRNSARKNDYEGARTQPAHGKSPSHVKTRHEVTLFWYSMRPPRLIDVPRIAPVPVSLKCLIPSSSAAHARTI
jgi:hypothetical protein